MSRVFATLPKIELHRHLEGSLRLSTLVDLARTHGLNLPYDAPERLRALVQVHPDDPFTADNFLSKFQTLRLFYRSPEAIRRVTREAVEDAAQDGVVYLELRFTPVALSRAEGFPLAEVMDWVIAAAHEAATAHGVQVGLIVSVNRHESLRLAERVIDLAVARRDRGVVGVDLAGDELRYPATPFVGLFRAARQAGLRVTIHAGEWAGAANVAEAIEVIGADRIGHGVRVMEDPRVVALARERGVTFEVCLTSNLQSGVVTALTQHPLRRMLAARLRVTLNSDDPAVSDITLSAEFARAAEEMGLPPADLVRLVEHAVAGAFLPLEARERLAQRVLPSWQAWAAQAAG